MYLNYINSFRAIAILFIVAGHSLAVLNWEDRPELHDFIKLLVSNGTVLFVFIAGYLFQHLSPKYTYKKYTISKLKNVVAPYIIVSIPAIVYYVAFAQREQVWPTFYDNPVWLQVIYFYALGIHMTPMWFIPMIIIFYAIAPLLIKLDKTKWFYYLLPVFFLVTYEYGRGLLHFSFLHFFSVYVFGMWCSRYKGWINERLLKKSVVLALLIAWIILYFIEYNYAVPATVNAFKKLILSLLFISLFISLGSKTENKAVDMTAAFSFGVYFIHSYVLFAMKIIADKYERFISTDYIYLYYFGIVFVVFCLSMFIVWFVKKLFGTNSRYVIGS